MLQLFEQVSLVSIHIDSLLILKPENQTAEQIFDAIRELCLTKSIGFVVLDSLGVMVSQNAYEESYEKRTYGGISIPLTTFTKEAVQFCKAYNITFIGIKINFARLTISRFCYFKLTFHFII